MGREVGACKKRFGYSACSKNLKSFLTDYIWEVRVIMGGEIFRILGFFRAQCRRSRPHRARAERRAHGALLPPRADRGAPTGLPSLLGPSPGTGLPPGCDPMPRLRGQYEDHRRTDRAHSHLPRRGRPGVTRSARSASTPPPSDRIRIHWLTPRPPASTP